MCGVKIANIKSAKKRTRVIATKNARNRVAMSALRTSIKKADAALEAKSEDRAAAVTAAVKKIDQAAAKGLIHKNTAARRKSALALKLNRA